MTATIVHAERTILLVTQKVIRNPILTEFFTAITTLGDGGMIWILTAEGAVNQIYRKIERR